MNLQVCVPSEPCVFKCPMCVARDHLNCNSFKNIYFSDHRTWANNLAKAAKGCEAVVITGDCDPTQNMQYVESVIDVLRNSNYDGKIEFTTHNQKFEQSLAAKNIHHLDVVTLSVTNLREYLNAWTTIRRNLITSYTYRMVILLTEEFSFLTPENFNTMGFDQVTFKVLQHGEDLEVNQWIEANKMDAYYIEHNIKEIVEKYNSGSKCSVRLDTSCQKADGRYKIFRSDGLIYNSWEELPSYVNLSF